jgi:hypothetical protein
MSEFGMHAMPDTVIWLIAAGGWVVVWWHIGGHMIDVGRRITALEAEVSRLRGLVGDLRTVLEPPAGGDAHG